MPIFDNNGKKQNVQDAYIGKYMELYPDATTIMERDGKKYRVKAKDYNTFLGDTLQAPKMESAPQTVTAPQVEADKSEYTFTGEQLGIDDIVQEQRAKAALRTYNELPTEDHSYELHGIKRGIPNSIFELELRELGERYKELKAADPENKAALDELNRQRAILIGEHTAMLRKQKEEDEKNRKSFGEELWDAAGELGAKAVGVVTAPVYAVGEFVGDAVDNVTGWDGIHKTMRAGRKKAEEALFGGTEGALALRNDILYKNGKDGELSLLGTVLQSTEEMAGGATTPVYDLLEKVGDVTGLEGVESVGKEGRRQYKENILADSWKKEDSFFGQAAQLVPQVAAIWGGIATGNPALMKAGTGIQVASSMGQAAHEAAEAGASGAQIFGASALNGIIELLTERIPLGRWLKKIPVNIGSEVVSKASTEVLEGEAEALFKEAKKRLGNKLTAKSAKEFAIDMASEGGSEFAAEFLQTLVPIIYKDAEEYPTFHEALQNGIDGLLGGIMMSGMIQPVASYTQRKADHIRRKEQGFVDVAQIKNAKDQYEVVEIVGENESGEFIGKRDNELVEVHPSVIVARRQFDYDAFRKNEMMEYSDEGYSQEPTGGNALAVANEYTNARGEVVRALGLADDDDVDAFIGDRKPEEIAQGDEDTEMAITHYLQARARRDGFRERYQEERDRQFEESDKSIDGRSNNGSVYTTMLGDQQVHITGGDVVLNEDGTIDVNNSSESLFVEFPDGGKKPVTPDKFTDKVVMENADALKVAGRAAIEEKWKAEFDNAENAYIEQQKRAEGIVFDITDDKGTHRVEVVKEDNNISNILVDGEQMQISTEELNALRGEAGLAQTESGEVEGENEVQPEAEGPKGENAEKVVESAQPTMELSPAQKREEVLKRIPTKGNERLWTEAEPADVAEYIRLLTADPAKQQAAADKFIADIKAKQEKVDAISALEMDEQIAYWESVKALLQGGQPTAETAPVVEETQTPVVESAPVAEVETPQATNEMQEADLTEDVKTEDANQSENNLEMVAEGGNAPGQSGVVGNNTANALQNGNNKLNLQKENKSDNEPNQNDIPVGGQVPQSVPQGEHGTQASQVSGAQETAARLRERIESAQGDSKSGLREVENRVTREFAQENGLWIEDEFKLGVPFPSGDEHNNYIDAENQVVYKVNNRMHTPSILDLLDRIEQHNKYFPDNKYSLVGFTSVSKNGDVMPVFAQDFVPDARMATVDEIDSYMGTLGFARVGDGRYSNGEVVIKDLKPRNVLADADGDIYVVDAEFEQEKQSTQSVGEQVQAAEAEVNTTPTDAQKEAGNYKKGHVKIGPFNISIEQPKGSVRSGVDKDGKKWEVEMQNTYGYFRGTEGVDGDHIDVFLSNDIDGWNGRQVFVVDQRNADGSFDEHKVMLGFNDINDAEAAYMSNYEEGWQGLGAITGVSIEEFEKWLSSSHRKTKAFAEYKNVKTDEGQSTSAESGVEDIQEPRSVEDKDVSVATEDERGIYLAELKAQQERQKTIFPKLPRPSSFVEAYASNDTEAINKLDKQLDDALQMLVPMDITMVEATIKGMKDRKSVIKAGSANGRKETPAYKAFDHIEKVLAKRKKQLEKELTEDDKRRLDIIKRGNRGELKETTQPKQENKPVESEPIKDETPVTSEATEQPETGEVADAGPVNRETLRLNMSEEDFNALLNSGDKAAVSEYLAEMDGLLRIGVGSPLDGRDAIVKEYRGLVEQYGGEGNIPADVVAGINERIAPYNALQRAVFDRKYDLQDKLREIETNEAQAKEQAEKEAKAKHKQTTFGGFLAGKTDLGASAAEKALSKKYNFDGKVMTVAEFVEDAVGNGNVKLSAIEEPKYKGASRAAWNRMDARQQEADAKRVKESGTKTVYTVNDHDLGKTAYDYAKFLLDKKVEQEKAAAKQKVKDAIEPFAKEKAAEQAPIKIEDVGEKIGGARKDIIRQYADKIKLDGKTFSTMFPKPDIDKLIEAGLPVDKVAAVKAMYDNAKREFEIMKKRRGKDKALQASLFYAMYAKNVLTGEEGNFDLAYNGYVFTEWGKEFMKANIALYKAVFNKLGADYGKVDLRSYFITPLAAGMRENFNLKKLNEENSRMQQRMAEMDGRKVPEYKDGDLINFVGEHYSRPSDQFETLEEAVNTMLERIGKEVKVGEAVQYKVESYWKRDAQGRADYTKAYLGIKVRGFGTVDVMEFKNMNEARAWLQDHREDFQQMAAAKEEQVKAEKKKPLPKYVLAHSYNEAQSQYSVFADFGKEGVRILKTFDIPQAEGVAAQAKVRSEVYKNEVLPYINSEEAVQSADGIAQEIRDAKNAKPKSITIEKKSRERVGVDWRNGKDATPEMFVDVEGKDPSVFGFRAIEFGNYVSQKERQQFLNDIYDALMDMSEILGVSPRALSLGGKLALAVGARGTSGASGHYEPYKNVINITKTRGAGVLAHEWLHALDRYFSNFDENMVYPNGTRYATQQEYADDTRQEVKDAFEKVMLAVKASDYRDRSMRLGEYWASEKELAARALQDYVIRKLEERGQKNDFLSNHVAPEEWDGDAKDYPFPLGEDVVYIGDAFDNFFATLQEKTVDGQTVLYSIGEDYLLEEKETEAFKRATKTTKEAVERLKANGLEVEVVSEEEANAMIELAEMQRRKSPETALPEDESSFKGTVISSDDGANILKDIDNAIAEYENKGNSAKTFIGDVARILRAVRHGSKSEYADIVTANGIPVRIRLADHNVKVSNYDNAGINDGISIVISRKPNAGITNDGDAHLVEFFYSDKKISKADGKPLVEILKSIKQALYSGEYKDNTGLAAREEVNIPEMMTVFHGSDAVIENRVEFLRTANGKVYGWAVNGTIYLMPDGINPNTPVHEYAHLWGADVEKNNPKLWNEVVEAMKLSPVWNEVANDANYSNIHGNDSRMASEVLARLSGRENYRRTMEQAKKEIEQAKTIEEKAEKISRWAKIKAALKNFWNRVQNIFRNKENATGPATKEMEPWDEFVNSAIGDFYKGKNPNVKESPLEGMFVGEKEGAGAAETAAGSYSDGRENTRFRTGKEEKLSPEEKERQRKLKDNAKAIRRLHNVKSNYPITALRNLGFALETQEQREEHDRLFAERDAISGRQNAVSAEVNPQSMTLMERITESLMKAAVQNKENVDMRMSAIRAYSRDLSNVLKLMRAQRGYDRNTVRMFTNLVKMYLRNNSMSGMSSYDITRLLGLIERANGGYGPQVMRAAEQIAEIITKSHTRELENIVRKQIKTGAEKVNASGVVVQGGVDVVGKRVLNTFRDAINMTSEEEFEKAFREAFERAAKFPNDVEAKAACDAMAIAKEYRDNIIEAKKQESELLKSINKYSDIRSRYDRGEITRREYNEFVDAVRKSLIELRSRMVDDYQRIIHALGGDISEGIKRAKEFRERELARVEKIHNMAEADMSGVSKSAERKKRGFWRKATDYVAFKNPLAKVIAEGLGTYNEFMKFFGRNAIGGKGRLYDYFIGRYTEVQNQEWVEKQKDIKKIDERCEMVFGKGFMDVMRDSEKNSGVVLEYWNGGERVSRDLSIGQLMYIYMTAKQTDGEMKLRGMGITEETVNKAVAVLPAKYKVFADWVQSDFLPEMRPRLNEVHKRMFGASMSEVKNYFPLVVNTDARQAEVDLNSVMPINPSTITGSIIKRKVNATPLNLESNAFDVLLNHVSDMEHWAAFAEFTRDNNTLIGDKDFMNRVKNSRDLRFGDGEAIWNNFVETARITTGNYRAKTDEWANVMKGVSSAKITFGYYTALKQFLSSPGMWLEASTASIIKATANPLGSWRWAIENLPGFEERWKGRTAGNERLADSDSDWSIWDNSVVKAAREAGMAPNAFIDAVVVSTGARAVYDSRKRFYKALGLSQEEQHKRALKDAAVAYNETQQSAQGAYLSILQKEGGFKAMVMTLYRNSQMAYSRKVTGSMAELYKKAVRWKAILDDEEKKYLEMGLSEEDAKKEANKALLKSTGKDVATLVMFGYVLNMVWYLGEQLPYLLFGDDEEEKEKIMETALKIGATGMFEGFALGNVAKDLYVKGVTGNRYSSDLLTTPFASDAEKIINRFANDGTLAGMSQLLILGAETATGISPQRLVDDVSAVIDFCNGDLDKATEVTLLTTRLAKVPQSQIDKLYLEEALGGDVVALAERYAEYKRLRDYPLNIGDDKILKKYAERFKKAHNEDLKEIVRDENAYEGYFSNASPEEKIKLAGYRGEYLEELTGKKAEEVLTGRELVYYTLYGRKEQNLVYSAMTTPDDVDDEICIKMMMSELKPIYEGLEKAEDRTAYANEHQKEIGLYKTLNEIERGVGNCKSAMKKIGEEYPDYAHDFMTIIRTLRAEAVELINKYRNE